MIMQNALAPHFAIPQNPGDVATIPFGTNAVQERHIIRQHEADKQSHQDYYAVEGIVKDSLVKSCGKWIETLQNRHSGYTNVTPKAIFAHLYSKYATVTDEVLKENEARFQEPWNPDSEDMTDLFTKMNEIQNTAASTDPISNRTLIRNCKGCRRGKCCSNT